MQTDAGHAHRVQAACWNVGKVAPPRCKCARALLRRFLVPPAYHIDSMCHDPVCKCCTSSKVAGSAAQTLRCQEMLKSHPCTLAQQTEEVERARSQCCGVPKLQGWPLSDDQSRKSAQWTSPTRPQASSASRDAAAAAAAPNVARLPACTHRSRKPIHMVHGFSLAKG